LEYDGGKVRFELVDNFRAKERKPLMLTLAGSCFAKKNILGRPVMDYFKQRLFNPVWHGV